MLYSLSLKFNKRNSNVMIESSNENVAIELIEKFTYNKVISSSEVLKLETDNKSGILGGRNIRILARSSKNKKIRQFLFHDIKVSNEEFKKQVMKYLLIDGEKIDFILKLS